LYDWSQEFHPYGLQHALCVGACAAIMIGVSLLGRRWRGTARGEVMRLGIGWLGVVYWVGSNAWWMLGPSARLAQSLPLHVCDLAGIIGPVALLAGRRWLRALLYFWGLSLSVQGFIQPVLTKGMAYTEFWLFWANHTGIVGIAVYDVVALGFRPKLKDFMTAVWASLAYLAFIVPFDIVLDVNYGYVGPNDPIDHHETLADRLGPWPWRIVPMVALGILAMWLLYVLWWLVGRWEHGDRGGGRTGGVGEYTGAYELPAGSRCRDVGGEGDPV
jgi:hypothetical integral membrane protein (TIGR02206 family)